MSRSTRSTAPPAEKKVIKNDIEDEDEEVKTSDTKKKSFEYEWSTHKTIGYGVPKGYKPTSQKIAGFDMDFTVIRTKSGKTFPVNENDWLLWDDKVKDKLIEYHKDGYQVVIFSNQGGIGKGHTTHKAINTKMGNIANEIGIPIVCLFATEEDENKKPNKGMWDFYLSGIAKDKNYSVSDSLYCGDAAGRTGPPKDFTDTDLKFALNIGIQFFTPEMFFLGKKEVIKQDFFNPKSLSKTGDLFKEKSVRLSPGDVQEMIIMVGSPGSGKSTFVDNHLKDYERVNRDTLKTIPKCLEAAARAIANKKNVVIDNTNPTVEARAEFIKLAKKNNIQVRAFLLEITKDLAFHLDNQRDTNQHRKHFSKRVGKIPIHSFFKNVQPPTKAEGFSEVGTVNFIAGPFKSANDENSFFSFTK